MNVILEPIGYVRANRRTLEDDYWGNAEAVIELAEHVPPDALAGLDSFSHAEILFYFDQVEPTTLL